MNNQREYRTVVLAALLHDAGKFLHRGAADSVGVMKHPEASAAFVEQFRGVFSKVVDADLLKELVQRHHEHPSFPAHLRVDTASPEIRPLATLVSCADNYSSGERRGDKARADFRTVPLVSVFSQLRLSSQSAPQQMIVEPEPLTALSGDPIPFRDLTAQEIQRLHDSFGRECNDLLAEGLHIEFSALLCTAMRLLERHTWCLPSDTQRDVPDISLYDHLRTTAAIAASLYQVHDANRSEEAIKDDSTERFRILVGDLSGIQRYIFDLEAATAGGIAKRLRARSFSLSMLSEIACQILLDSFHLPPCNVILSSGGKFYILLPELPDTAERIERHRSAFNQWCMDNFNGILYINLASVTCTGKQLGTSFGDLMHELARLLGQAKAQPLRSVLQHNGTWNEDAFLGQRNVTGQVCDSCRRLAGVQRQDAILCEHCNDDLEMGRLLAQAKYIAFYQNPDAGAFTLLDRSFDILDSLNSPRIRQANLLFRLRPGPAEHAERGYPILYRPLANYVPRADRNTCAECPEEPSCTLSAEDRPQPGQTLLLNCLAARSTGRQMLGILKADVDHLGKLFTFGLPKDNISMSRIATLSRMFEHFFSARLHALLENDFPFVYTVFSGGDDLFLIGPWDTMLNFTHKLHNEFTVFAARNPDVHLSAGLSFESDHVPILKAHADAEELLEISKNIPAPLESLSRNQFTVFNCIMKWHRVEGLLQEAHRLFQWLNDQRLATAFARDLLIYARMRQDWSSRRRPDSLRFLPLMNYNIARNLKDAEVARWAENLKMEMADLEATPYVEFIAQYALSAIRGGRSNGHR